MINVLTHSLCFQHGHHREVGRGTHTVQKIATGWTVRESNPGGKEFSTPVQNGPRAYPTSYTMGTGSLSRA
jgi:hypothetical protein